MTHFQLHLQTRSGLPLHCKCILLLWGTLPRVHRAPHPLWMPLVPWLSHKQAVWTRQQCHPFLSSHLLKGHIPVQPRMVGRDPLLQEPLVYVIMDFAWEGKIPKKTYPSPLQKKINCWLETHQANKIYCSSYSNTLSGDAAAWTRHLLNPTGEFWPLDTSSG